jgi:glyoxylase-like metal-dependent hydrolase (beta-lactamase superfamily II)/ferredoxin
VAELRKRLSENAPGDFFVDSTCIDCGTCRQVAPEVFAEGAQASYVHRQPVDETAARRARMALVACPVAAIGSESPQPLRDARIAFPEHIADAVYYCGYASEASYGARSYLIVRERGNVLVDSPRYAAALLKRVKALGGVRWMFLTHRDDVADHRKFRDAFGCERIMHKADIGSGTRDVEILLEGREPVALDDEVTFIPLPGHTPGSAALLYRRKFLFSGDHAWWDAARSTIGASRDVCWYDWRQQIASMRALASYPFEWLLPGHGLRGHASAERMREEVLRCVQRMETR